MPYDGWCEIFYRSETLTATQPTVSKHRGDSRRRSRKLFDHRDIAQGRLRPNMAPVTTAPLPQRIQLLSPRTTSPQTRALRWRHLTAVGPKLSKVRLRKARRPFLLWPQARPMTRRLRNPPRRQPRDRRREGEAVHRCIHTRRLNAVSRSCLK